MNCPNCGRTSVNERYCRTCGTEVFQSEAKTKIFNTTPVDPDYYDDSNQKESRENPDARFSLKKLAQFIIKFALILGGATILLHILIISFAPQDPSAPAQLLTSVKKNGDMTFFIMSILSILVAIILITPIGFPRKIKFLRSETAQGSFHQFLKGWSAIWITWFLLYLYISVIFAMAGRGMIVKNFAVQITVDFLNTCTSTAFLFLFLILDMPSISTATDRGRNKEFKLTFNWIIIIGSIVFLFSALGRINHGKFEIGVYISGIFAAIAMAYVFGRLDSHYMNVPRWMLAPLYLYAVIQVAGPILVDFGETRLDSSIEIKDEFQKIFFVSALLLKIYLFVVVNYWLHFGALEKYFNFATDYIEETLSTNN